MNRNVAQVNRRLDTDSALALVVGVLAVVPFLPTLDAGFLADDWFFAAAYCRDPRSLGSLVWQALFSLEGAPTTFYRPLPFISLAVQVRWSACDPWSLHALNLVLHGLVCAGFFWLARRLTAGPLAAVIATLALAWFPRRVEAVAWLSCRPDLLAAAFSIASVLAFEAGLQKVRKDLPTPFFPFLFSLGAWWLALLSKESALLLPLVHGTLAWQRGGRGRALARWLWPFAASWPVFLVLRRLVIGAWAGGYGAGVLAVTPATIASVAKHLAYQVIPPLEIIETVVRERAGTILVGGALVAGLCVMTVVIWRNSRHEAARVGLAWWLATAVPVVTLPVSLTTTFNDRLLYLPAIGVGLLAAATLQAIRSRAILGAALAVCLCLGAWSTALAGRWARAGALTAQSVTALADALRGTADGRVYLAAAPDSLGGAYMLRNGIRHALSLHGVANASRVTLLSWYFVAPFNPEGLPVRATFTAPATLDLDSVGPLPQVIVGTPDARAVADHDAPSTTDRFGRRQSARLRLREPGVVWLVRPGGAEPVQP